jgi:hypothetical protein
MTLHVWIKSFLISGVSWSERDSIMEPNVDLHESVFVKMEKVSW